MGARPEGRFARDGFRKTLTVSILLRSFPAWNSGTNVELVWGRLPDGLFAPWRSLQVEYFRLIFAIIG